MTPKKEGGGGRHSGHVAAGLVVLLAAVLLGANTSWHASPGEARGSSPVVEEPLASPELAEEATNFYREGNRLFEQGELSGAEQSYERAVEADPGHVFSWANLGNLLRTRGDIQRAISCHERAYQLSPQRPRSSYNLAVSLQTANKYQAAFIMYTKAIELFDQGLGDLDVSHARTNLGVCLQGLGQLEEAIEQYALAKKLRPDLRSANLNYCNVMLPLKGTDAAVGCFSALLDRDPAFEQALSAAAGVHHLADNLGAAAQLYQRALAVNPSSASAQHGLAAISGGGGDVAPAEYVRDMFNGYALTFDESLKSLRYQSPELLRSAVDGLLSVAAPEDAWAARGRSKGWRVLDGGCGTGLCGPLFRNVSAELAGVDLSENMVALARKRNVYDELVVGELVQAIEAWGQTEGGDVVLAADVLVYFGNLEPFLTAAARAVRRQNGLIAFTTEMLEEGSPGGECAQGGVGWKLTSSGRYAHCRRYAARVAEATGLLQTIRVDDITPRWNRGKPVAGVLYLMRAL
jgi:predicted TPR repeat methyltransferase